MNEQGNFFDIKEKKGEKDLLVTYKELDHYFEYFNFENDEYPIHLVIKELENLIEKKEQALINSDAFTNIPWSKAFPFTREQLVENTENSILNMKKDIETLREISEDRGTIKGFRTERPKQKEDKGEQLDLFEQGEESLNIAYEILESFGPTLAPQFKIPDIIRMLEREFNETDYAIRGINKQTRPLKHLIDDETKEIVSKLNSERRGLFARKSNIETEIKILNRLYETQDSITPRVIEKEDYER